MSNNIDWSAIQSKIKDALLTLPHFFRNPVRGMTQVPDWGWPETLILQGAFAAACGIIADLIRHAFLRAIVSVFLAPLANYFALTIAAGFFYYVFMFFFKRELPFRRIYLHVLFASIPAVLINVIAPMVPPIILIGVVASAMLLYVGFISEFQIERKKLRNLMIGLVAVYTLTWVASLINTASHQKQFRLKATPESLDILQKELNH